eukprot:1389472-Amphidinium_carterae.1
MLPLPSLCMAPAADCRALSCWKLTNAELPDSEVSQTPSHSEQRQGWHGSKTCDEVDAAGSRVLWRADSWLCS